MVASGISDFLHDGSGLQDQIFQEKEKWAFSLLLKVREELAECHFWLLAISQGEHSTVQIH